MKNNISISLKQTILDIHYLKIRQPYWNLETINVPSSENGSANLSAEKAKDSEETTFNPPKVTVPSSKTSPPKTHDINEESIENESSNKSKTDTTGQTISQEQTTISKLEKINV